jgi:hypothetical protein
MIGLLFDHMTAVIATPKKHEQFVRNIQQHFSDQNKNYAMKIERKRDMPWIGIAAKQERQDGYEEHSQFRQNPKVAVCIFQS